MSDSSSCRGAAVPAPAVGSAALARSPSAPPRWLGAPPLLLPLAEPGPLVRVLKSDWPMGRSGMTPELLVSVPPVVEQAETASVHAINHRGACFIRFMAISFEQSRTGHIASAPNSANAAPFRKRWAS